MDFKSFVNKESFKAILHHHLKNQVRAKFGNSVLKSIEAHSEKELLVSDNVIESIGGNISQSEESKEFLKTFLNSLNNLFEDKEKYIPKEENQGTLSQCSSASSVSTSIDYISFDQFQDIIHTLSDGIHSEKLEALETFSRLPSLEHIIKRTLWPSVENGLHNALLSHVSFLKEASLKVYIKMLSSSEPKVVQESFNSLMKHLLQNLLPSMNQNVDDFVGRCKSVVEIIAILNSFLQNIPNHWLRYPQPIIEDITMQSISMLSFGSRNSNIFPVWLCIALCDKKSKWLKTLLYGHVSKAFFLDALQKESFITKFVIEACKKFNADDSSLSWSGRCCQKYAEISEIIHIICFLSYLLQYSEGRKILSALYSEEEELFSWLNVLDLVMKCSQKLCSICCLSCCSILHEVVPKIWHPIWSCDSISMSNDSLVDILLYFNDIDNLSVSGINFIIQCLFYSSHGLSNMTCSPEPEAVLVDFMCTLFKYLTNCSYDFPDDISPGLLKLLNSSLMFVNKILTDPSNLFVDLVFINTFASWCSRINSISTTIASSYCPGTKSHSIKELEQNIANMFISMLQKPNGIIILQNLELLETSINVLLENILKDIKLKRSVCPRDISMLSTALNNMHPSKSVLNRSITFRLSAVIWQLESGDLENLPKVKCILDTLMPSICPDIFENELLLDVDCDIDKKLFHTLILYPGITKQEFVMLEEYNILALQVISLLTCSILSSCYFQAKYKLSEILFDLQLHHYGENGVPVIDPISVLQNHLLVKLYTVGGSEERILPPETLLKNNEDYGWPFFKNYPVPNVYCPEVPVSAAVDIDVTLELNGENLKDIFLEYIESGIATVDVIAQMLKASINMLEPLPALSRTLNFVCLEDVGDGVLQDEIVCGLDLINRFGENQNLISEDDAKTLEMLLKAGKGLLSSENRSQTDLFVSTLGLIFRCDMQASWIFLESFAKSSSSLFVWYERILQAVEHMEKYVTIFNIIMEHCDTIVKKTLPFVHSALQFGGVLPSALFKYWTIHCYWNYLNFTEIAQFILITVIFGGDFAIYFFVSILKHMEGVILKHAHSPNLMDVIKQNSIKGYKVQNYMQFMIELGDTFQSKISKSISNVFE